MDKIYIVYIKGTFKLRHCYYLTCFIFTLAYLGRLRTTYFILKLKKNYDFSVEISDFQIFRFRAKLGATAFIGKLY